MARVPPLAIPPPDSLKPLPHSTQLGTEAKLVKTMFECMIRQFFHDFMFRSLLSLRELEAKLNPQNDTEGASETPLLRFVP